MENTLPIVKIDEKNSIVILELVGPLSKEGFEEISKKIDNFLEKGNKLNGVIIYTKDFPYWDSFSGFISHLKFIKNHHKEVPYLAFVTDSIAGVFAEKIGDYFVKAEVKNFDYKDLEEAKEWIASDEDGKINHGFIINKDLVEKKGILELKIVGKLTDEDYKKSVPQIDSILEKNEKMPILIDMTDFKGWELKAAWDDFKFGMKHNFSFGKIAAFGINKKWIDYMIRISSWFMNGKMAEFNSRENAIKWLEEE